MFPLDIQLQSIAFVNGILNDSDVVRVSLTTFPEEQKFNTTFEVKNIKTAFPSFTVNVSDRTEKILIVFRKKLVVQRDPIIASAVITNEDFPKFANDSFEPVIRALDIYEPRKKSLNKENSKTDPRRKVLGKLMVKLALIEEMQIPTYNVERFNSKKHSGLEYAKINTGYENGVEGLFEYF